MAFSHEIKHVSVLRVLPRGQTPGFMVSDLRHSAASGVLLVSRAPRACLGCPAWAVGARGAADSRTAGLSPFRNQGGLFIVLPSVPEIENVLALTSVKSSCKGTFFYF